MTFEEATRQYANLHGRLQAGQITQDSFSQAVQQLRVQDTAGRWWQIDPSTGGWLVWNGSSWLPAQTPMTSQPVSEPAPVVSQTGMPTIPHTRPEDGHVSWRAVKEQVMMSRQHLAEGKGKPLAQRSQRWWDALAVLGGIVGAVLYLIYSSIRGSIEGYDLLTPLIMVAIPLALVFYRGRIDRWLLPVQPIRRKIPKLVLIGAGLATPYAVASFLYSIVGLDEYWYMRCTIVLSTMIGYMLTRTPQIRLDDASHGSHSGYAGMAMRSLILFSLLLLIWVDPAFADDCAYDPFNLNDCLRTGGYAQFFAGTGGLFLNFLVNGPEYVKTFFDKFGPVAPPLETEPVVEDTQQNQPPVTTDELLNDPGNQGGSDENEYTEYEDCDCPCQNEVGIPFYQVNTSTLGLVVRDTIFVSKGLGPEVRLAITYNSPPAQSGMFGNNWRFCYESRLIRIDEEVHLWKGSGKRLRYRTGTPGTPNNPVDAVPLDQQYDRLLDYGSYWLFIEKATRLMYRYDKTSQGDAAPLSAIIDYNGNTHSIQYAGDGTIQTITDFAGRATRFAYDQNGRCVSFTVVDGRTAHFRYDEQGNLVETRDMMDIPSRYDYDDRRYLTRMLVGDEPRVTVFAYEGKGRKKYISAVMNAAGHKTTYELVSERPRHVRVNDPEGHTTEYFANKEGLTSRIVDPLGHSVTYGYEHGNRTSVQNKNGHVTRMTYDTRGNVTGVTDPLGNTAKYEYDIYDNLNSRINALSETSTYVYDSKHRMVEAKSPLGHVWRFEYNARGETVALVKPDGSRYSYSWDRFGNVTSIVDPFGHGTLLSYTPSGFHISSITDAQGNATHYHFDNNNRLTKVIHPDGTSQEFTYDCCAQISSTNENGYEAKLLRGPMSRIQRWIGSAGFEEQYKHDLNGNLTQLIHSSGKSSWISYDAAGRISEMMNPAKQVVRFVKDPEGNLKTLRDSRGNETQMTYDANQLLTGISDSLGNKRIVSRDGLGRVQRISNARGQRIEYNYDLDGNTIAYSIDDEQKAIFEYDQTSNLVSMSDGTGKTVFLYTATGKVKSLLYPDQKEIQFIYDNVGNLNRIVYPDGLHVDYDYDNRDRIIRTRWGKEYVNHHYDRVGNIISEERSNGTNSAYTYNASNFLIEIQHLNENGIITHESYQRNSSNSITAESRSLPLEPILNQKATEFTFNDVDQILSQGNNVCKYDADGNLIEIGGGSWGAKYDEHNRLVEVKRNGQTSYYHYNGLGQMVKVVNDSSVRNFLYDHIGRLLLETEDDGAVVAWYIYRNRLLLARIDATGRSYYYHIDKTGSVLALSDNRGQVAAAYTYAPFGSILNQTGKVDNPFTFVGALGVLDEDSGLYFMQNRFYDAQAGRFIQKDPIGQAGGINQYAYVGNNPINLVDPQGLIDKAWWMGLGSAITNAAGSAALLVVGGITSLVAVIDPEPSTRIGATYLAYKIVPQGLTSAAKAGRQFYDLFYNEGKWVKSLTQADIFEQSPLDNPLLTGMVYQYYGERAKANWEYNKIGPVGSFVDFIEDISGKSLRPPGSDCYRGRTLRGRTLPGRTLPGRTL